MTEQAGTVKISTPISRDYIENFASTEKDNQPWQEAVKHVCLNDLPNMITKVNGWLDELEKFQNSVDVRIKLIQNDKRYSAEYRTTDVNLLNETRRQKENFIIDQAGKVVTWVYSFLNSSTEKIFREGLPRPQTAEEWQIASTRSPVIEKEICAWHDKPEKIIDAISHAQRDNDRIGAYLYWYIGEASYKVNNMPLSDENFMEKVFTVYPPDAEKIEWVEKGKVMIDNLSHRTASFPTIKRKEDITRRFGF